VVPDGKGPSGPFLFKQAVSLRITMDYNETMKTLIIAVLMFLDIIPSGVPFVSNWKEGLESKVRVEERNIDSGQSQNDAAKNKLLNFSPLPQKNNKFYDLTVGARAYITADMGTGEIILEKDKDKPVQVASLTKLMTARLLLKDGNLAKTVAVNDLSKMRSDDARANLVINDEISNRDLLKALLINSASDAALTIVNNLYSGGYNEFVSKMNEEAVALGLKNTHFDNPVGWDSPKNYSTPQDLQILARILLKNDEFKKTVAISETSITSERGYVYPLKNTNILLDAATTFGVKTGTTLGAGECLIALTKIEGKDVLYVILGANDRFSEARNLFKWTEIGYNW